ncbi:hypothetical protein SSX86_002048 [Deinandra increscens subsp. villosa]|uniref:Uncharacterized protein n=1 Tax=Deinandra increscens subsp. villosa TaxID=3103831 RepID=A0AAP0DNH0_9ASTR
MTNESPFLPLTLFPGNKIGGSCLSNFFYKFKRFILPEAVFVIDKSLLGDNNGKWTVTPDKYKLGFNNETEVVTDSNWNGSNYAFNFTSFDAIIECKPSQTTSFDIIGVLKNCPPIKSQKNAKEEVTNSVCVLLRDLTFLELNLNLRQSKPLKATRKFQMNVSSTHATLIHVKLSKIIGKTHLEVFGSFTPPKDNPFKLPPEIESFIETKYAFKIFVSEKHISKIFKTYTINSLTSDKNIIKALEDKYINYQVASLQENANDDNITPESVNMTLKTILVILISLNVTWSRCLVDAIKTELRRGVISDEPPDFSLLRKLRRVKVIIKEWNSKVRDQGARQIASLRDRCVWFDEISEQRGLSEAEVAEWTGCKENLGVLEDARIRDMRQKARIKWAIDEDENTVFLSRDDQCFYGLQSY